MTTPPLVDRRTEPSHDHSEPRPITGLALFVPAGLVAVALAVSGNHSSFAIVASGVAFVGIPLLILLLRQRSAHHAAPPPAHHG
jgi:ACR3 family arsenite efflux pump ArsB